MLIFILCGKNFKPLTMKRLLSILFIVASLSTFSQPTDYQQIFDAFLTQQFGNTYQDKGNMINEISRFDFSDLWLLPGSTGIDDTLNFTKNRTELLGFIGDSFQRIYIHFIQITKYPDDPFQYFVFGKSMVKKNVCNFVGTIKMEFAREVIFEYHQGEDFLVNPRSILKQGVVVCDYTFMEDRRQNHVGIFTGKLVTSFYINKNNQLKYNAIRAHSDSYMNNQFIGTWSEYNQESSRPCNFGEWRITNSRDLDVGAGCFFPNKKYHNKGWGPKDNANPGWWKN